MPNYGNGTRKPWFRKKSSVHRNNSESSNYNNSPKFGYDGFSLYFPNEESIYTKEVVKQIGILEKFIDRNQTLFVLSDIERNKSFIIDYKTLFSDDSLSLEWQNLNVELVENTEHFLNCIGLAMHQTILKQVPDSTVKDLGLIRPRLVNFEPILQLRDLRVNYYGKMVSVRGTVIKARAAELIVQYMLFTCNSCSGTQIVKQIDRAFTLPSKCPTEGCKTLSNFAAQPCSSYTRTIAWQAIRIQELIGTEEYENGRVPRTFECEFTEDLVNSCVPGDDITVTGIVKVQNAESSSKSNQNSTFLPYLYVISVVNNKNQNHGSYGAAEKITFNIHDYYAIQKIHAEPQLFRYLVQSLCPNIYGHEMVKAGLLLSLFGGTKGGKARAESHILIVGDPGLGKSQMLQACTNVAPRGVYVCANTSTNSGLTVTMTRESGGEYSLEAGALMLADQGCCCIDEFDKMPSQHACLLEAMEQQSISIAKAGILCTLPTRTTILAAANPVKGHYNKSRTIAENLKISSPMLSRFDLIFILLDNSNEHLDKVLSNHILALHSVNNSAITFAPEAATLVNNFLKNRLKVPESESIDYLPHNLFRKYIAYAQKYVSPQLSDEAKKVIKNFHMKLRKQFRNGNCTPVTTRQLHSLIRLTQARAKAELREEATEQDALDVVEIMENSLIDIFTDSGGVLDTTRSQNGIGMSSKNQILKLLRLLQNASEIESKSLFSVSEIKEISDRAGIPRSRFYNTLQTLNIQGFLLNKGSSTYQLISADL